MTPGCTTLRNAVIHLALPLVSFYKSVGGPCSDIHNSYISTSYRGPCLRATGFLLCPAVLPCGDKTMWLRCIHRAALFLQYLSAWKNSPLSQVCYSHRRAYTWSTPWSFCWQTFYSNDTFLNDLWLIFIQKRTPDETQSSRQHKSCIICNNGSKFKCLPCLRY